MQSREWQMGAPIVSYWAGPMPMTEAAARQMAEGNWNLAWCTGQGAAPGDIEHYRRQLDIIQWHGLRAIVSSPLFNPATLDTPEEKAKLDAFVEGVRDHPAVYGYHFKDEPNASAFPALARMKAYLDEKDPSRLKYVNLLPNYASAKQLGTEGDPVHLEAYEEHVRRFVEVFKPQLLSYDHYHFAVEGDGDKYFLNLAQIRHAALEAGIPFMVIVQACSWTVKMRIPTGNEVRWLANTTLAYGSQGISYYVYGYPEHDGAMMNLVDGSPTPLYHFVKEVNKEFLALAGELKSLKSIAVYHAGMLPEGTTQLPADAPFRLEPPVPPKECSPGNPVEGYVIGYFGEEQSPTHALVVNLDYRTYSGAGHPRREEFLGAVPRSCVGPGQLEVYDASTGDWTTTDSSTVELRLPPGGALLTRLAR